MFSQGFAMDTISSRLCLLLLCIMTVSSLCPENLQYGNGECCSKCGAGFGVESVCTKQNDTNCAACVEGETFSSSWSYTEDCVPCTTCIKNAGVVQACNSTHDAVCECNPNFFYDPDTHMCKLCQPCAPGSGASRHCNSMENTICEECSNGTFSDVLSATGGCFPCTVCGENQVMLQECSPKQDTICMDISLPKPTIAIVQSKAKTVVGSEGINVIPLYCALMAAIVVGLLVYVIVKNVRRGKDTKRFITKQPHDDIEYAAAEKGDSGIFLEPEVKSYSHSLKVRDLPYNRRRDVEQSLCIQKDKRANWKILARELGFNRAKVETLENQAEIEMIEPAVYMFTEWCKNDCASVGAFLRALKKVGRTDIARVLNGDNSELRPLNDGCSH